LLLPWGSVARNISFFLTAKPSTELGSLSEFFAEVEYAPGNMERFLNTEVYKLSSGQQTILAVYCALARSPRLLVADEIFQRYPLRFEQVLRRRY
jgi:ABC-type nitrate/sulfonate/bicarbonate transport system ATPase subunit